MTLPPLWPHQAEAVEHLHHKPKLMFAWSPRMGKTRGAAEDYKKSGLRRCIIAAPLAVCKDWVDMMAALGFEVWPAYKHPVKDLRRLREMRERGCVVVINDDKLANGCDELLRFGGSEFAFIGDESHRYKAPSGQRSRAARHLIKKATRVRLLTGTPAPNHYGDLWAQMVGLDPEAWGYTYTAFRDRFLLYDPTFHNRVYGHKNTDVLQALILRFSSIVRREDVFGPDDFQYVTREVEMPSNARRLYDEFAARWMIEEPVMSADNTLVRILRLRQIAAGFVEDKQARVVEVLHSAPIDRLIADLSEVVEADEKAVVVHQFSWEGARVAQRIRSELGVPVYEINGHDAGADARQQVTKDFNTTPGARVAVVQVQSGSLGISFADAGHLMFLSSTFSFSDMEQARDRVYAPDPELGKGKRRVIYSYRCAGTIHEFIGDVLDRKGNVHDALRNADREAIAYGSFKRRKAS